jgi:hypothetical protein
MRYALALALATFLAAGPANAEALPSFPKNATYETGRKDLQYFGWRPAAVDEANKGCSIGREDVCQKFPEAEACSGTGMGRCTFLWKKGQTLIEIATVGEEIPALTIAAVRCRLGCR